MPNHNIHNSQLHKVNTHYPTTPDIKSSMMVLPQFLHQDHHHNNMAHPMHVYLLQDMSDKNLKHKDGVHHEIAVERTQPMRPPTLLEVGERIQLVQRPHHGRRARVNRTTTLLLLRRLCASTAKSSTEWLCPTLESMQTECKNAWKKHSLMQKEQSSISQAHYLRHQKT